MDPFISVEWKNKKQEQKYAKILSSLEIDCFLDSWPILRSYSLSFPIELRAFFMRLNQIGSNFNESADLA